MSEKSNSKNNFVMQAGILAAAGIISRMIGLLYRSPLHTVIGNVGLGYYQAAYAYYQIILLISSYSIPSAISKVIAQKLAVKEYKNAHRIFHCAMIYVLVVGGAASVFLFLGAGLFVETAAIPVLRTLAPTIFVYGMLGVLRGYFQAHKSMVQTSVSQIFEQILNAAVSVGAAYLFMKKYNAPEYGAIGSALGTLSGVVTALLVVLWAYAISHKKIKKRIERDNSNVLDDYKDIFKSMLLIVTPIILSTFIYNFRETNFNQ